jgi:osmotically-inducible protein OsmY
MRVNMTNDEQLQYDVEQVLRWDPSVRAEQIGVSVTSGVVELDGHVDSYYEKLAAERAVMRVSKVKAVASEIKVELPSSEVQTDEDIARIAMNHLEWNYTTPSTVKLQVTDGCVTLKGTTEWQFQKEEAKRAIRPIKGLTWVCNEVTVIPNATAVGIKT